MRTTRTVSLLALTLLALPIASIGQTPDAPLVIGGHLKAPKRTKYVPPVFDPGAKGLVILELVVAPDGSVHSARPKSADTRMATQAIIAARRWRYQPTIYHGQPAWISLNVTVRPQPQPMPESEQLTVNVADPAPAHVYFQGRFHEVPAADIKLRLSPGDRGMPNGVSKSLLQRLALGHPIQLNTPPSEPHCKELALTARIDNMLVSKTLLLYSDRTVRDSDRPAVVYVQSFDICPRGGALAAESCAASSVCVAGA